MLRAIKSIFIKEPTEPWTEIYMEPISGLKVKFLKNPGYFDVLSKEKFFYMADYMQTSLLWKLGTVVGEEKVTGLFKRVFNDLAENIFTNQFLHALEIRDEKRALVFFKEIPDKIGKKELVSACTSKMTALIQEIGKNRKDLLNSTYEFEDSVLPLTHVVALYPEDEISREFKSQILHILFTLGANPDAQDESGNTLAHNAAMVCDIEFIELLEKYNANLNILNKNNETPSELLPIMFAASGSCKAAAQ